MREFWASCWLTLKRVGSVVFRILQCVVTVGLPVGALALVVFVIMNTDACYRWMRAPDHAPWWVIFLIIVSIAIGLHECFRIDPEEKDDKKKN